MDGQADQAPITEDDLAAAFLADTSDETGDQEEQLADDESTLPEDNGDVEDTDESPDEAEDEPEAEEAEDQTSSRKFKVTVKGEDGADLEQEVDEKELIAGYQRHSDYTRKTQDLARREEQAVDTFKAKIIEAQNVVMQQTQVAHAAVLQLAGLRTPEEMAQLAHTDPAMYVAEKARADQVQAVLKGLQNQHQQAQFHQQQAQQAELQKQFSRAWGVLGQKGIDKPKLQKIFETVQKDYGVPEERFATLSDPNLVLIMADAVAYRELQKKKTEVTKKAEAAPRLPQRQNVPRSEGKRKRLDAVFKSGKAGANDLASLFASM